MIFLDFETRSAADLKAKYSADEEIGSSNFAVIPGLINAHHHVGLTPFQLGALDAPPPRIDAKFTGDDPDRHAGLAATARRTVGDVMTAAKSALGQDVVTGLRVGARKVGEKLLFDFSRQIGTAHRPRSVKNQQAWFSLRCHGSILTA